MPWRFLLLLADETSKKQYQSIEQTTFSLPPAFTVK
jgi:hypothetical protein